MSWNDWSREAEKGTGGEIPELDDDIYNAMIKDVSEPQTRPDPYNQGKDKTDFYITIEVEKADGEYVDMRYYVALPEAYINDGYLNEKSKLYKLMETLGYDLTGRFRVNPPEWIGQECRVLVENKPNKDGEMRPRITDLKPSRSRAREQKKAPAKQPVGATNGGSLRQRLSDDGED